MMFWILLLASLLVAMVYVFVKARAGKLRDPRTGEITGRPVGMAAAIFFIGLLIAIFQPFKIGRVDAGSVGIKVKLVGDSKGVSKFEYKTGWVVYNTWTENLYEFPTFQQHIDYEQQSVITRGGFEATIKPSFNYSLKSGQIGDMFSSLRLNLDKIQEQWLQTAIVGTVNDVSNKWNVDDIFNHREQFEADILKEANKRIGKWFTISQLRTNITPPKALQESIVAKTRAIQEVQVAENQKMVAVAEGQRKIAEAQADSAQRVIRAAGEAEEMRRKQLVLTKDYLDFLKIQKWNGENSKVVTAGNGGGVLLNVNQ